jgi:hypothetical protein
MTPMSLFGLLMTTLFVATPACTADDESGPVCAVLTHPREYVGQTFTFKGRFFHGVHATYFVPENQCDAHLGIQAVGSVPSATNGRGTGMFTAKGKFVIHRQRPERMTGKPAEVVAFSVLHTAKVLASPKPANQ